MMQGYEVPLSENRFRRLREVVRGRSSRIEGYLQESKRRYDVVMVTLTYARDGEWQSDHIASYTKRMRAWLKRCGIEFHYCWVAELTQRGRVHYHFLIWLPKGCRIPKSDERGWWEHGSTRTEKVRSAVGYITGYVAKISAFQYNDFPSGLRLHGGGSASESFDLRS